MNGGLQSYSNAQALAALAWLVEAGCDTLIDDAPHAWLAPPAPAQTQIAPPPVALPIAPCEADAVVAARALVASVASLSALQAALAEFDGCALATHGAPPVFAAGTPGSRLMVVGEMPSADKVLGGQAGLLLDRMLAAISLTLENVYLTNLVYWPTPGGRTPAAAEIAACAPFLARQIALAKPRVVLALGGAAAAALTGATSGIAKLRGKFQTLTGAGTPVMPIFHPQQLLAQPALKALAWRDLLALQARLTDA